MSKIKKESLITTLLTRKTGSGIRTINELNTSFESLTNYTFIFHKTPTSFFPNQNSLPSQEHRNGHILPKTY